MTMPTAPELSDAERAVVERFEAAPYPAEVLLSHLNSTVRPTSLRRFAKGGRLRDIASEGER